MKNIQQMIQILRCPKTGTCLTVEDSSLVSQDGNRYPIINGKPILVRDPSDINLTPPEQKIISKNHSIYTVPKSLDSKINYAIHLGCGNVPCEDSRVISIDIIPTDAADIVAESESLPFLDGSIDFVQSGAVFEHVYNPFEAISEVKRVLKEGGTFTIDTAFMQSYHGFPSHYFNMTPQAIETYLADDFNIISSLVPNSGTPIHAIVGLLGRFLKTMSASQRKEVEESTVSEFMNMLNQDRSKENPLIQNFSEYDMRAMAASFLITACKPENHTEYEFLKKDTVEAYTWSKIKREYYSLRTSVMCHHSEISNYRRRVHEVINPERFDIEAPISLSNILTKCKVDDTLSYDSWNKSIILLKDNIEKLLFIRNQWIREYMKLGLHK